MVERTARRLTRPGETVLAPGHAEHGGNAALPADLRRPDGRRRGRDHPVHPATRRRARHRGTVHRLRVGCAAILAPIGLAAGREL
ncbi:hypothetical protein G6F31_021270 [Rhizopus arrhizus]|nr:hypothetical protein G6F31_021270 [Rhizopus arrhizus]